VSTEAPPAAAPAESSGVAPNVAAGICALLPLVGGVVFLALEKKDAFVRFWAMQSVFFGGAWLAVSIGLQIIEFILRHIPYLGPFLAFVFGLASLVLWIGLLVIWVVTIIKAFSNVEWEIPYLGKLARKQLAGEKLF
jgi:uncharacterized membrane protein